MKVATILFTYHRSRHTKAVLDGLRENYILPEKLFIFQDGMKASTNKAEWGKVNNLIKEVSFCPTEVIVSSQNNGLAQSIVNGLSYVFQKYDAVIVLEDDCVPDKNFINYMYQSLNRYEKEKHVCCISGYAWPISIPVQDEDVYFIGRISSWGWGTWKDRWLSYQRDPDIFRRIQENEAASRRLYTWGRDLPQILRDSMHEKNDSWAIYWALTAIERDWLTVVPVHSLIRNVGHDGSGVHCGTTNEFDVALENKEPQTYRFPQKCVTSKDAIEAYMPQFGCYIACQDNCNDLEHVLIYGAGNCFWQHELFLASHFFIEGFIDRNFVGTIAGRPVISLDNLGEYVGRKIIITLGNLQEAMFVARTLHQKYAVPVDCIVLLNEALSEVNKSPVQGGILRLLEDNNFELQINGYSCALTSIDEYNNVRSTLEDEIYDYHISGSKSEIVFDVGMNVGDSVLFFLQKPTVKKIYAFEPFSKTVALAMKNLKNYLQNERLEIFPYGLSSENACRSVRFNSNMTCGMSSLPNVTDEAAKLYQDNGLISVGDSEIEKIRVRKASEVFCQLLEKDRSSEFILKMDCEGEEYSIVQDLYEEGVLGEFRLIMLEWHYKGKKFILEKLRDAGFSYYTPWQDGRMGWIYAYR